MVTQFKELLQQLKLSSAYTDSDSLSRLEHWCEAHISQDRRFEGKDEERYAQYFLLAQDYFEKFLANIPNALDKAVSEFKGMNAIQYASDQGYNHYLAKVQLNGNTLVNAATELGITPLHLAASNGFVHTVKVLIARGAVPNQVNHAGQFPLFNALRLPMSFNQDLKAKKIEIFNLLLKEAPYTVNAIDESGETVVHAMAVHDYDGLIQKIADEKMSLLFQANNFSKLPIHSAILNNKIASVNVLMQIEGMNKVCDVHLQTPLHYAARYGTEEMVQVCCAGKKSKEAQDDEKMTPILLAAQAGNLPAVEKLVALKANTNAKDYRGYSLLHHAVLSGNKELVTWVLEHVKPDVNAPSKDGHNALYCLMNETQVTPNPEIEQLLIQNGSSSSEGNFMAKEF